EQKKFREAVVQVETYLRSQPQAMEGYELRIELQKKLGRDADIVRSLEADSGRDPNNTPLRLLLAREYRKAGRAREAERIYTGLPGPPVPSPRQRGGSVLRTSPRAAAAVQARRGDRGVQARAQGRTADQPRPLPHRAGPRLPAAQPPPGGAGRGRRGRQGRRQ